MTSKSLLRTAMLVLGVAIQSTLAFGSHEGAESRDDTIEKAMDRVCEIEVNIPGGYLSGGTGFLVGKSALVVTNYHVIEDGTSAQVRFKRGGSWKKAELVAVQPDLDLALIRVSDGGKLPSGLDIITGEPKPGSEVFAIGYPEMGLSVTKGVVTGVRRISDLPKVYGSGYRSSSRWVQTDCTINAGNSGGPLIDMKGNLVGVNTWKSLSDKSENAYFALHAAHVEEILDSNTSGTIPWSKVRSMPGQNQVASGVPTIRPRREISGSQMFSAAMGMQRGLHCDPCDGDGDLRTKRCHMCDGTGLNDWKRASKSWSKTAEKFAGLNLASKKADQAFDLYVSLLDTIKNRSDNQTVREILEIASDQFSSERTRAGTPVCFFGKIEVDRNLAGLEGRHIFLSVMNSPQLVLAVEPRHLHGVEGETVFVSGIFAGWMAFEDEETFVRVPVIRFCAITNG